MARKLHRCSHCRHYHGDSRWSLAKCRACIYAINALHHPAAWRGVLLAITASGAALSDTQKAEIIGWGMGLTGLLSIVWPGRNLSRPRTKRRP